MTPSNTIGGKSTTTFSHCCSCLLCYAPLTDRRKHVLHGVHIGAIRRIPLNSPYASAMRPFCQIT